MNDITSRFRNDGRPEIYINQTQVKEKNKVIQKIDASIYEFKSRSCQVCRSEERDLIAEKDMFGLPTTTVLCKKCGFLYTDPSMRECDYIDFYSNHYRKLYEGVSKPCSSFFKRQLMRGKMIFQFIEKNAKRPRSGTVIEIGCGAGGVLYPFHDVGYRTIGFDYNNEYLEFGNNKGLELKHTGQLNTLGLKADIVIVSHVLEHVFNLEKLFLDLKLLSHENTLIYIEVPGIFNLKNTYCRDNLLLFIQNAHLYNFSLRTLQNLMMMKGFELVAGTEFVRSIFIYTNKPLNAYVSVYNQTKTYLEEREKQYTKPISLMRYKLRKMVVTLVNLTGFIHLIRPFYHTIKAKMPARV